MWFLRQNIWFLVQIWNFGWHLKIMSFRVEWGGEGLGNCKFHRCREKTTCPPLNTDEGWQIGARRLSRTKRGGFGGTKFYFIWICVKYLNFGHVFEFWPALSWSDCLLSLRIVDQNYKIMSFRRALGVMGGGWMGPAGPPGGFVIGVGEKCSGHPLQNCSLSYFSSRTALWRSQEKRQKAYCQCEHLIYYGKSIDLNRLYSFNCMWYPMQFVPPFNIISLRRIHDWCCLHYFLRNSLVALLGALFARIFSLS